MHPAIDQKGAGILRRWQIPLTVPRFKFAERDGGLRTSRWSLPRCRGFRGDDEGSSRAGADGARTHAGSCGTMTGWCQLAEQFCSRSAQRAQRVVGHAEGVFDGLGLGDEFRFQRATTKPPSSAGVRVRRSLPSEAVYDFATAFILASQIRVPWSPLMNADATRISKFTRGASAGSAA